MIHEFKNPVPVVVENDKDGYAIYVRDGGTVRHYRSDQLKIFINSTFDILKK